MYSVVKFHQTAMNKEGVTCFCFKKMFDEV